MTDQAPATSPLGEQPVRRIPLDRLVPSKTNPRKHFDKGRLEELAASVRSKGVLQPITVRPLGPGPDDGYEIVLGERRYRAAKLAESDTSVVGSIPAIVRNIEDDEVLEIQLIENVERDDLTVLEEADSYKLLLERGKSAEEIALRAGKSRSYVYSRAKLAELPASVRGRVDKGELSASVALLVARIHGAKRQEKAAAELARGAADDERISFRRAREIVEDEYMRELKGAPWKLDDAELLPGAGPCTTCPNRSGNQRELFGEAVNGRADVCTAPSCYAKKLAAHGKRRLEELLGEGVEVVQAKKGMFGARPYWGEDTVPLHSRDYVEISDRCDQDPKRRTYQQLLGKDAPEAIVACVDPQGQVRELLPAKGLTRRLKARGHDFQKQRETTRKKAAEPSRSEKVRRVHAAVGRLGAKICASTALVDTAPSGRETTLLRLLTMSEEYFGWELLEEQLVAAGLVEPTKKKRSGYILSTPSIGKGLEKANGSQLRSFVVEALALGQNEGVAAPREKSTYSQALLDLCRVYNVNLEVTEKRVVEYLEALAAAEKEAAKAKRKAGRKAGKKKTTKKAGRKKATRRKASA